MATPYDLCMPKTPQIVQKFGKSIRKLREERGISQEKLATRSGVHRTYIGMIERGEKNVTLSSVEKLAKGLGVRVKELMDF